MTSVTGTGVQLPPELQRLVDDVVSELMTAADPVAAARWPSAWPSTPVGAGLAF